MKINQRTIQPTVTQHGFTLIELVMVIVVLGILGAMGSEFISQAFKGFFLTEVRIEMYEEGKTALMRMERELHTCLPNAVQVSGDNIEFGMIDDKAMTGIFGQYTEDSPSGGNTITDYIAGLPAGSLVSVYTTQWADFSGGGSIYRVTSSGANPMTLSRAITQGSPYQRFHAVQRQAVRYSVTGTTLSRATATVTDGASLGAFGNPQTLARNLAQVGTTPFFTYAPGTSTRNGMISIHFAITRDGESLNFHKEIHIRNVS